MAESAIKSHIVLVKANTPFLQSAMEPDNISNKKSKSVIMVQGDVPYVHQVYDTPDWHNGNWSCAPTTAIMTIAYTTGCLIGILHAVRPLRI